MKKVSSMKATKKTRFKGDMHGGKKEGGMKRLNK